MQATEARAREHQTKVREMGEQTVREQFDVIDKLKAQFADAKNGWDDTLRNALERLDAGAISIQEFLSMWGDAVLDINGHMGRVRDLFRDFDMRKVTEEIQQLMLAVRNGADGIDAALKFLTRSQAELAVYLAKTIEAFRKGEATLEDVAAVVRQIEKLHYASDLADLANALEQALRQGDFGKGR